MPEQELKLHVPAASRQAVQREIKQREATRIRLHAMYFDTPERELARARIAIRLRLEGRDWVRTLKMPGADAITRIEMNHPRPGPVLDLSVYAGTDVAPLAAIKGELGLRYETDVLRLLRRVRTRHGMVELAYDTGILRAGTLELPISELEFELVSGKPRAIFAAARGWQQRHALVLDPQQVRARRRAGAAGAQTGRGRRRRRRRPSGAPRRGHRPVLGATRRGRDQAARGHEPAASHGRHRRRMPGPDRAQRRRAGRSGHRGCVPRRQFRTRAPAARGRAACVRPGSCSMAGSRRCPTPCCSRRARTSPPSAPTATRTC